MFPVKSSTQTMLRLKKASAIFFLVKSFISLFMALFETVFIKSLCSVPERLHQMLLRLLHQSSMCQS